MSKRLIMIEIVLKNGAVFTVPASRVLSLNFDKISQSVVFNPHHSEEVVNYKISRMMQFEIDDKANNNSNLDIDFSDDKDKPFDYFGTGLGLTTYVELYFSDGTTERYYSLWSESDAGTNYYEKVDFNSNSMLVTIKKRRR